MQFHASICTTVHVVSYESSETKKFTIDKVTLILTSYFVWTTLKLYFDDNLTGESDSAVTGFWLNLCIRQTY